MGNSISNEECDAKIRKAEENGKQSFINKFNNKKDHLFNVLVDSLKSPRFKETIFSGIRNDADEYLHKIRIYINNGRISVPGIDNPTELDKEEYISRITVNVNNSVDDMMSTFEDEISSEISNSKISKMRKGWNEISENLIKAIDRGGKPGSRDVREGARVLGELFYVVVLKSELNKKVFNLHKGVVYSPAYKDGSAGSCGYRDCSLVEPFVNGVEDEHKFSKILLVLIVVVLFLHLFTDFKIF